jgi:mono/diheme cytochrome c family protein
MFWPLLLMLAQAATPTQVERGEALFMDTTIGCASCHALKGKGTAVGPDLKAVARLTPVGIAMSIRSTATQYVQMAKIKGGADSFPAMTGAAAGDTIEVFDLSKTPPESHKAPKADVSFTPNNSWKHPPSATKWTSAQLADLIAYIRYAGAGSKAPVDPDDIP